MVLLLKMGEAVNNRVFGLLILDSFNFPRCIMFFFWTSMHFDFCLIYGYKRIFLYVLSFGLICILIFVGFQWPEIFILISSCL